MLRLPARMEPTVSDSQRGRLRADLASLQDEIGAAADATIRGWQPYLRRDEFHESARNLAQYLALRAGDRTSLQRRLRRHGLSTLGRSEGHVMASLRAMLATLDGRDPDREVDEQLAFASEMLAANTATLFGPRPADRSARVLVTLSPEVGCDPTRMRELLENGANAVRINCAHDDPELWRRMAATARSAARDAGLKVRVLMDLGGPKIRTCDVRPDRPKRLEAGDRLWIRRDAGAPTPPDATASCGCTMPLALSVVAAGAAAAVDDGKLWAEVEDAGDAGLLLRVSRTKPGGIKLKPDKGLNFPGTALPAQALTQADRVALPTVGEIADLVGYSFVQRPEDMDDLAAALAELPRRERPLGVLAKIETELAFRNLPEIMVRAAGRMPFGVMVARGDLGVEVGFPRLSEVQEEILWLCEAAHVPVVWATDVLTSLVKNGVAARGEFTDAAMSARAECVMLNKGPYIVDGVRALADVLHRTERHLDKKTPQLTRLHAWYPSRA